MSDTYMPDMPKEIMAFRGSAGKSASEKVTGRTTSGSSRDAEGSRSAGSSRGAEGNRGAWSAGNSMNAGKAGKTGSSKNSGEGKGAGSNKNTGEGKKKSKKLRTLKRAIVIAFEVFLLIFVRALRYAWQYQPTVLNTHIHKIYE